ncbi:Ribosomal RNA large subunit methyltransferase K/L [bioreactor metagenome]|uniref:Ribosomal RNA large subunit methyltransferase K/L n=1 Tax=bioreactor metagenome TaxID=1076179 RepID=A0A644XZB4_9ZZZZ
MKFYATCKLGLESLVTRQLRDLDIEVLETEDARVSFSGGAADMARALLWLRTAERVLLVVGEFEAETFDSLFEQTKELNWKKFLKPETNIHVNGKSAKSTLFSVSDCQSIVKKAIIESLKAGCKRTTIPEGGEEIIVEVGILRNKVSLCLDCCGAGLSRRGYRTFNVAAPLAETLGAAIVMLSRYRADLPLIDPMCGSGTMPIEAAMIAQNIAPGLNRSFAAESWWFFDKAIWAEERNRAQEQRTNQKIMISGFDIDPRSIDLCKMHAKKAGVFCDWGVRDIRDFSASESSGVIVCNPPYGERMLSEKDVKELYRQMRRVFAPYPGWSVNIFSGMREFETVYGKRADKRRKLTNGGMPCTLYQYFGVKDL